MCFIRKARTSETHFVFRRTLAPTLLPTLFPTLSPSLEPTLSPALSPEVNDVGSIRDPVFVVSDEVARVNALENDEAAGPFPNRLIIDRITDQARDGKCVIVSNGRRVDYTPDAGFLGRDRCSYVACDRRDDCGEATIFFDVEASSQMPTLFPTLEPTLFPTLSPTLSPVTSPEINSVGSFARPISVMADETSEVAVLLNDRPARPLPNRLTIDRITKQARNGRCTVRRRGVDYTPKTGFEGRDRCTYEACDSRGECGEADIFFSVEVIELPTLSPTLSPTLNPSLSPTLSPSLSPSFSPTFFP